MKLLEEYSSPVAVPGITSYSVPTGVQNVVAASIPAAVRPLARLTQNTLITLSRLSDLQFSPAAAGVISLESASLQVYFGGGGPAPLYRAISPSSLTALVDGNVLGLTVPLLLPGASILLAYPGTYEILTIELVAVVNNTSASAVNLTTSGLSMIQEVRVYDTPIFS